MLRAAAERSRSLVIGVDADAASMERASRRAARPPRKGGLPNACFVVAAAEALPSDLDGRADEVRLHLPWGSLLTGFAGGDPRIVDPLARLCAPGGEVVALLSSVERDGLGLRLPEDVVAAGRAFARAGLCLREVRTAGEADLRAADTTWARRLGVGRDRPAFVVRLERV